MLSRLNERQREAAEYIGGPLLVLAGAGSGKTSVITSKIAYLIKEKGIKANRIAAVTFTNKASREMKARVGKLVQGKEARGLTVSTFHNLGLTIIRREHKTLGYKSGFSLFDDQDTKSLIKDLMHKDFQTDAEIIGSVQHMISGWKNDLIEPEQAAGLAQDDREILAAAVYREYDRHLQAYNAVDFDDLIRLPVRLFRDNPEVLDRWQNKIHYMLVDEYQDTNISQYLLVKLLIGYRGALTVVGDDDQSIYAWRGARPENLIKLGDDFKNLKIVKLEQNYRSTSLILRCANTLIANNPHVYEKTLWSNMGSGAPVRVISCRNEDAESERVVTEILTHRIKNDGHYKDFAILYRSNHQARLLEIKLQAYQVPYKISGGTSFFSRHEIKDIMGYLRLLVNPEDDNAFLRVINMPRREIGPSTLERLGTYANSRHISLFNACSEIGLEQYLSGKALEKLGRFNHWLQQTIKNCYQGDPIAAIRQMIQDIDYEAWLYQNSSSPHVAEKRMANVWILLDSLKDTLSRMQEDDDTATIEDAISRLVLRDMLEQQEKEDDSDRVQLMTLHSAKGLEYPHVYIIGMEEDLLPHRNSIDEGNIEEERRLAYVGITRARETLTLSFASQRKQFGEMLNCTPSRFLDELPEADLAWEGKENAPDEAKRARGHAALDALKKRLGNTE
ncbi:DNA helicase Rep [Oceanospirillum maris]|uniref:DNA helicase Rep n=1 Tax=Oceanospirillum maris TaxID=64977 RepID=UPI000426CED1|nr:DNA helicase Rep [Oceanospirillum maris]